MNISAPSANGLQATAAALRTSQARFDASAAQVTDDAAGLADPASGGGDLAQDLVGMQSERLTNAILAGVFRRQSEQQQDVVNLVAPR